METRIGISDKYVRKAETELNLELTQQQVEDACLRYIAQCGVRINPKAKVVFVSWIQTYCSPGNNGNMRIRVTTEGSEPPILESA